MLKWIRSRLPFSKREHAPFGVAETTARAHALFQEDAWHEVEIALRNALQAQPSGTLARMLGALYASQQRYEDALDALCIRRFKSNRGMPRRPT
jgi:cytochrome c-type biogenesis protein CcmH/NrfG